MNHIGLIDRVILNTETITVHVIIASVLFVPLFVIYIFSQGLISQAYYIGIAIKTLLLLMIATGFAIVSIMSHLSSKLSQKHGIMNAPGKLERLLQKGLTESEHRKFAVSFGLSVIAFGASFGVLTGLAFSFYAITSR